MTSKTQVKLTEAVLNQLRHGHECPNSKPGTPDGTGVVIDELGWKDTARNRTKIAHEAERINTENPLTDETDEEAAPRRGSVISAEKKKSYGKDQNCGDKVVHALAEAVTRVDGKKRSVDLGKLADVADDNGIDLDARWGHLNPGMQRMNLGNVLRGKIKRGEEVRIGSEVWEANETE